MEYLALIAEIETLKAELDATRTQLVSLQPKTKQKPERVPCPHVTSKGSPCKKYCAPDIGTCKVHSKPMKEKAPPKPKFSRPKCTGINMRGNPCKGKCMEDQTYCERHDPNLAPKEKTKKSKKKDTPLHNHLVGVEPLVQCELCDTHGDMFDMSITDAKWVDEATYWARRTQQTI